MMFGSYLQAGTVVRRTGKYGRPEYVDREAPEFSLNEKLQALLQRNSTRSSLRAGTGSTTMMAAADHGHGVIIRQSLP